MPYLTLIAHLALAPVPAGGGQINPAAVARESDALLERARTAQGSFTVVRQNGSQSPVDFVLRKPNHLVLRSLNKVDIFNGMDHVVVFSNEGTYERRDTTVYGMPYLIGFTSFLENKDSKKTIPAFTSAQVVSVEGRTYVRRTSISGGDAMSVDIDPTTKLPARWSWRTGEETLVAAFHDVRLDERVPNDTFDTIAATAGHKFVATAEERALFAVGTSAPTIEGKTLQGRNFDLREYSVGKRATIVAFLDPQSQSSASGLAQLGTLVHRRDIKGVGVVAISNSDDPKKTRKFLKACRFDPPTFVGAPALSARRAFGVQFAPTFFVLDPEGTVLARSIGFDKRMILAALDAEDSD